LALPAEHKSARPPIRPDFQTLASGGMAFALVDEQRRTPMRKSLASMFLSAALIVPGAFLVGCDDEIAHEESTVRNPDGTGSKTETTVKEKDDGTVVKETEKKVDNTPDNNPGPR
jgi:hypothetical protein